MEVTVELWEHITGKQLGGVRDYNLGIMALFVNVIYFNNDPQRLIHTCIYECPRVSCDLTVSLIKQLVTQSIKTTMRTF